MSLTKWPNFHSQIDYNRDTTIQLLICQFFENAHIISALITIIYEGMKICNRIALNGSAVGTFVDSLRDSISRMIFHYRMLCLYYVTIARRRVEHRIMVTYF